MHYGGGGGGRGGRLIDRDDPPPSGSASEPRRRMLHPGDAQRPAEAGVGERPRVLVTEMQLVGPHAEKSRVVLRDPVRQREEKLEANSLARRFPTWVVEPRDEAAGDKFDKQEVGFSGFPGYVENLCSCL
jgi:hypothetical protein